MRDCPETGTSLCQLDLHPGAARRLTAEIRTAANSTTQGVWKRRTPQPPLRGQPDLCVALGEPGHQIQDDGGADERTEPTMNGSDGWKRF